MFLSGGIDSSADRRDHGAQIDRPLQTFSVAFEERAFNELAYAREVAKAIGAEAHEVVIDDREFFGALAEARSGTRTSRSPIRRACRCISCRRWRGGTSPWC